MRNYSGRFIDLCESPPPYKAHRDVALSLQNAQECYTNEKESDSHAAKDNDDQHDASVLLTEKKQRLSSIPVARFTYIQPVALRSWERFLCFCNKCSFSVDNLTYNLWYFQQNYISVLLAVVLSAVFFINNCDLNISILVTAVVMCFLCFTHKHGYNPKILGRRLSLLERMVTVFMFALPAYGLVIPGTAPINFLYFLGIFVAFTIFHACASPVQRCWLELHQVHEI